MSRRRVAITGLGIICSLGNGVQQVWSAVSDGQPGIAPMQFPNESPDKSKDKAPGKLPDRSTDTSEAFSGLRFQNVAQVRSFNADDHFDARQADHLDRFAQFAVVAARQALKDAGRELTPELRARSAVVTGSCMGGQTTQDIGFADLYKHSLGRVHPLTIPRTMANAGASHICMEMGITGPAYTVSTACSSSNHAIGQAFWMVRDELVDMAIAGGSEAPFSLGLLKAWDSMRVVSPDTCRPFAKNRRGLILGEGAAMLLLEPLEAAEARGATVYAELAGFGMSSDAYHITHPSVEGPEAAMRAALRDAGLTPEQVDYINAHGTGTLTNDATEVAAIKKLLGAHASKIAVSSTKSLHGHALGAAGALEAVLTILAINQGLLPPTANFTEPDPECDLDVVPNQARSAKIRCALSNSFAFGGLNSVLAFRAYPS